MKRTRSYNIGRGHINVGVDVGVDKVGEVQAQSMIQVHTTGYKTDQTCNTGGIVLI